MGTFGQLGGGYLIFGNDLHIFLKMHPNDLSVSGAITPINDTLNYGNKRFCALHSDPLDSVIVARVILNDRTFQKSIYQTIWCVKPYFEKSARKGIHFLYKSIKIWLLRSSNSTIKRERTLWVPLSNLEVVI